MLENKFKDTSKEELDKLKDNYPDYFLKAEEYDYKIHIYGTANKFNINKETTVQKPELEIKINYKYSITSPHFNHALEMFMNKTDDHMSLVSQFHLPCVRAFYNGENVYMTPSCIFAHMTLMNIDYKYFAGSKDPIEIINKNRMRGFGTWLNENEIKNLIRYSADVDWWNNLYGVDKVNPDQSKIRGCLNYDYKLVHPRLINADQFYDAPPVNLDNGYKQINKGTKLDKDTKKVEATEATGSGSSGQYSTTAAWAKSTNKKDWMGKSKTQIPGGKFVQVKKKCKKFPYCNQGDIKALKIYENETVKKAIKNISEKHNISENVIKSIISYEYEKLKSNK
jgi:hypothetical protein